MRNTQDRPLTSGGQSDDAKKQEMPVQPPNAKPEIRHQEDKPELARKPDIGSEPTGNKDQQR